MKFILRLSVKFGIIKYIEIAEQRQDILRAVHVSLFQLIHFPVKEEGRLNFYPPTHIFSLPKGLRKPKRKFKEKR